MFFFTGKDMRLINILSNTLWKAEKDAIFPHNWTVPLRHFYLTGWGKKRRLRDLPRLETWCCYRWIKGSSIFDKIVLDRRPWRLVHKRTQLWNVNCQLDVRTLRARHKKSGKKWQMTDYLSSELGQPRLSIMHFNMQKIII